MCCKPTPNHLRNHVKYKIPTFMAEQHVYRSYLRRGGCIIRQRFRLCQTDVAFPPRAAAGRGRKLPLHGSVPLYQSWLKSHAGDGPASCVTYRPRHRLRTFPFFMDRERFYDVRQVRVSLGRCGESWGCLYKNIRLHSYADDTLILPTIVIMKRSDFKLAP